MKKDILRELIKEFLNTWDEQDAEQVDDSKKETKVMSPQEVASILDAAMGGRHASGRKFHPAFVKKKLNESDDLFPDEQDIEDFLANVGPISDSGSHNYYNATLAALPLKQRMIMSSIWLFTSHSPKVVRDPSLFVPAKSISKGYRLFQGHETPDQLDYNVANRVMTILANREDNESKTVYRGIPLPKDPAFIAGLKPGVKFNNWPISSFTLEKSIAVDFSAAPNLSKADNYYRTIIIVNNPNRGTYIDPYSMIPGEEEFISSMKLVIDDEPFIHGLGHRKFLYLGCKSI